MHPVFRKMIAPLYSLGHLTIITFGLVFEFICHLPFRLAMHIMRPHKR